jgi:hypothetical protein
MRRSVVAGLLFVTAISTVSARTPGQQPEGYPAIGAPAIVKLISAGVAPRSLLRYTVVAGDKQRMDTTMNMSMSMDMGGQSMPAMTMPGMRMGADLVVTDVSAAGDLTYTMTFNGVSAEAGADPAIVAQMQAMTDNLKSIKGTATLNNRGVVRTATLDFGKVADSPVGQVMKSMSESLKNLSTPLPEEEVGVGARWEVRYAIDASGVKMFQRTEFELVAFDGKTVTLKTKTEQTAPAQAILNPAMPPGTDIQLQQMTSSGAGTMSLRLNGLVPTSDAKVESTMVMLANIGGNSQQMSVTTSLRMTVAPGK